MNQFTGTPKSRRQKICHAILNQRLRKFKILFQFPENILEMLRGGSMHKHLFRTQNEIIDQRPSSVLSMQGPSAQTRLLSVTCHHLNRDDPTQLQESPYLLQCDVQVRELTEDDWRSIPNFPPDDLRELQQIIEPPCTSTFSSVKWELKQVPSHTFEVRTE